MPTSRQDDVTRLLVAWGDGDEEALQRLMPLVHDELHRLARIYMRRERPGHTLQTTALLNEAYLRLVDAGRVRWQSRGHFLGIAARSMRRILVDHARSRGSAKRGANAAHVPLEDAAGISADRGADLVALDEALQALAQFDARKARVVELRFFGGSTVAETAEVLGVSEDTVLRDWRLARSWLWREMKPASGERAGSDGP
jgi:RNA polymerase sigma factor (TIGR02999 family)